MVEEALIGFIVLEVLEDDKKRPTVRGKTWKCMKRRQEQGFSFSLFFFSKPFFSSMSFLRQQMKNHETQRKRLKRNRPP